MGVILQHSNNMQVIILLTMATMSLAAPAPCPNVAACSHLSFGGQTAVRTGSFHAHAAPAAPAAPANAFQQHQAFQGHSQFAQPQFAQPQFAQPQFAQPQFAPPQFAQPQFAQSQFAQPQQFSQFQG